MRSDGLSTEDFPCRFYSTAVLDHVHRAKALEEWHKLGEEEPVPLERALGSFDMFILHDQRGDLSEVCLDYLPCRWSC
jgi:F-box protein 21